MCFRNNTRAGALCLSQNKLSSCYAAMVSVGSGENTKRLFFMLRFGKFTVGRLRNSFFVFSDSFYEGLRLAQDRPRSASTAGCPLTPVPLN